VSICIFAETHLQLLEDTHSSQKSNTSNNATWMDPDLWQ